MPRALLQIPKVAVLVQLTKTRQLPMAPQPAALQFLSPACSALLCCQALGSTQTQVTLITMWILTVMKMMTCKVKSLNNPVTSPAGS